LVLYDEALTIQISTLGRNHEDVATTCHAMGTAMIGQSEWEGAAQYLQKALEIRQEKFGRRHSEVASTMIDLGSVLESQESRREALELFQEALSIQLECLGEGHLELAKTFDKIGNVCDEEGRWDEALKAFQKAMDIRLKNLDSRHLDVAGTLHNMGIVLMNQGKQMESLEMHQRALSIRLEGGRRLDVALSHTSIGDVLYGQERLDEAMGSYQKALNRLGNDHVHVADYIYCRMAEALQVQEEAEEATEKSQSGRPIGKGDPQSSTSVEKKMGSAKCQAANTDSDNGYSSKSKSQTGFVRDNEGKGEPEAPVIPLSLKVKDQEEAKLLQFPSDEETPVQNSCLNVKDDDEEQEYAAWCKVHGKEPNSTRRIIFMRNLKMARYYSKKSGVELEMNEFADLSGKFLFLSQKEDEFQALLAAKEEIGKEEEEKPVLSTDQQVKHLKVVSSVEHETGPSEKPSVLATEETNKEEKEEQPALSMKEEVNPLGVVSSVEDNGVGTNPSAVEETATAEEMPAAELADDSSAASFFFSSDELVFEFTSPYQGLTRRIGHKISKTLERLRKRSPVP